MRIDSVSLGRGSGLRRPLQDLAALCAVLAVFLGFAEPSSARRAPRPTAEFTVAGANGYSIDVMKTRNLVTVTVAKEKPPFATISPTGAVRRPNPGNVAATKYLTGDFPGPGTINANLGGFGTIAVAFQPSGERKVTKVDLGIGEERCAGSAKIVRRLGVFSGTIHFAGENGYTSVDLTRAPGSVGTQPPSRCVTDRKRPDARPRTAPKFFVTVLDASNLAETGFVYFSAVTAPDSTRFAAQEIESGENVNIVREAVAIAPPPTFVFPSSLESATATPPAPFSGRGSLHGASGAWRGTLSVAFPGAKVPLTGPQFKTKLVRVDPTL